MRSHFHRNLHRHRRSWRIRQLHRERDNLNAVRSVRGYCDRDIYGDDLTAELELRTGKPTTEALRHGEKQKQGLPLINTDDTDQKVRLGLCAPGWRALSLDWGRGGHQSQRTILGYPCLSLNRVPIASCLRAHSDSFPTLRQHWAKEWATHRSMWRNWQATRATSRVRSNADFGGLQIREL